MEMLIDGCDVVWELILQSGHAELMMNRNPNAVILSTVLADQLVYELLWDETIEEIPAWKKILNGSVFGLKVIVVSNKGPEFIHVLEIQQKEDI